MKDRPGAFFNPDTKPFLRSEDADCLSPIKIFGDDVPALSG